jgi:hypothetical protein
MRRGLSLSYCVSTATLVSPRTVLVLSLNVTKMRLLVGSNGTELLAETKIPKVGVALELIVVATVGAGPSGEGRAVGRRRAQYHLRPRTLS